MRRIQHLAEAQWRITIGAPNSINGRPIGNGSQNVISPPRMNRLPRLMQSHFRSIMNRSMS